MFLEEVTRTVLETGAARISPTVEDVLMARIDRLPPGAKSVLQTSAVIGRQCSRALLERVVDDPGGVGPALETLVGLGLLQTAGGEIYSCDQPLLHEVTYEGLLNQHRKALHRRIGQSLEQMYAARLAEHVEDLARLPDEPPRVRAAIELQFDLCRAKFQLGQLDDVLKGAREAETLATRVGDEPRLGQVYAYVGNYHYMKGEPDQAIRYGRQCLELGDSPELAPPRRAARQYLGTSYHALGQYRMAEEILTEQVDELEASPDHAQVGLMNLTYVSSAAWLAFTFIEIGEFARAHEAAARATRAATDAGHPYPRAIAAAFSGLVWQARGQIDRALPAFEASHHLCLEHQLEVWRPVAGALLGHASVAAGKIDRGLDLLWDSTALTERLGVQAYRALWITLLAEALLVNGQTRQAVEVAERALALATQNKELGNHTRALWVLGRGYLVSGAVERAGEYLRQALEQAERLRMRPLLAGCYHVLAAFARREGDLPRADGFSQTARALAQELDLRFWWDPGPSE